MRQNYFFFIQLLKLSTSSFVKTELNQNWIIILFCIILIQLLVNQFCESVVFLLSNAIKFSEMQIDSFQRKKQPDGTATAPAHGASQKSAAHNYISS